MAALIDFLGKNSVGLTLLAAFLFAYRYLKKLDGERDRRVVAEQSLALQQTVGELAEARREADEDEAKLRDMLKELEDKEAK